MIAEMPNARLSEFDNYNVETRVLARSKASTFVVTDDPSQHSDQTMSTADGEKWAKLQDQYIAGQDMLLTDCFIGHVVGIRPGDIVCGSPQIAFLYGLCAYLVDTPRFGAAAVIVERATPEILLRTIEKYRATVCFSTPSGYKLMLEKAGDHDLSSLRVCIAGGEPLAPAPFRQWRDITGVRLINGFGISELLHIFISAAGEDIRPGALGKAIPGLRVRVVDDALMDVAPGEIRQIIVKGPNG